MGGGLNDVTRKGWEERGFMRPSCDRIELADADLRIELIQEFSLGQARLK